MANLGPLIRGRIDSNVGTPDKSSWAMDVPFPLPGAIQNRVQHIFPKDQLVIRVTWQRVPGGYIQMYSDPVLISVIAGGANQDGSVEITQGLTTPLELQLQAAFYEVAP